MVKNIKYTLSPDYETPVKEKNVYNEDPKWSHFVYKEQIYERSKIS